MSDDHRQDIGFDHQDCVIVSSIDWSTNWQTHQQLASSLVESGHRVLFIENTGVRGPHVGDFDRIRDRIRNWIMSARGFFDIKENLTVFSPIFLPFPYSRLILVVNRYLLSRAIGKWAKSNRFHNPVLITFLPTPLIQALIYDIDPILVLYYCADDMSGRSAGAARLKTYEDAFLSKTDGVFCTSHALVERAERFNKHVFLFPAGVQFSKFEAGRTGGKIPEDLANVPKPVIGYVGAISAVFDQELLVYAARAMPEASFVLIGPEIVDVSELKACRNVKLLGVRSHDDVPGYIKGFDVALIPYVKNVLTEAVYSCKLNEYLAMGAPVVSTDLREIRLYAEQYGDVLGIAKDRDEFIFEIRRALVAQDEARRSARIAAARVNSWEQRFEDICKVINQLLEAKQTCALRWQDRLADLYRIGRMRMIKAGLILGACYAVLFHTPFIWFAGDVLVMRDAPIKADAIVVFSGDGEPWFDNASYQNRVMDALSLYRAGYAGQIVLSSGRGLTLSETDVVKSLLISHGISSSAILMVSGLPKSTLESVQRSAEILRRVKVRSILFVTAPYHSLRAYKVWKKVAPDITISAVSVIDTPSIEPKSQINFNAAKVIAYEYQAIIYYWWNGWV